MRIGIDVRLQNETGVGRYIRNLMTYLPKLDTKHEYVFINPDIAWHSIEEQIKMPRILDSYHLDLVHIPYFNVPLFYTKPFVVTIHDLIVNEYSTGEASTRNYMVYKLKQLGYQYVLSHAVKQARAIIVPSQATKDKLIELYPHVQKENIQVTYEGAYLTIDKASGVIRKKIRNLNNYFLYVGNAYPHKNVETLVKAIVQLKNPKTTLIIVGSRNFFMKRLERFVNDLHASDRIVFTGEVSDAELSWLYRHAQALVLPSLMEGFGLPALEAMQFRCPVIASDIPVFHEICQDAALYFDPNRVDDLASMLTDFMSPSLRPETQKKKNIGEKRARQFSWENMVHQTISIYEDCLSI
ncbi:glycosyltransferase family 4 protein [Candidatus Roizmanbacteria bacterium]|nr:glycosyltransferase family 4 protein [Candidatus Roizmanbacteria bacterium]